MYEARQREREQFQSETGRTQKVLRVAAAEHGEDIGTQEKSKPLEYFSRAPVSGLIHV